MGRQAVFPGNVSPSKVSKLGTLLDGMTPVSTTSFQDVDSAGGQVQPSVAD